jgi:HAMP domain-containing protein
MAEQKLLTMPELPILKHLDLPTTTDGSKPAQSFTSWKKGEQGVGWLVGLALAVLIGYGLITILPIILIALGKTLAAIGVFALVALAFMMWPVVYKAFRRLVRAAHQSVIRIDPFAELEDQLGNMRSSRREFESAKNEINSCKVQMKQSALEAEKSAKIAQEKVLDKKDEAESIKKKLDGYIAAKGDAIRETDEFVELENRMATAIGDGNRAASESQTYASLVDTFASRANIFGKLDRKLMNYGHAFDEKIKDFEMSIKNLKTVATGMASANNATTRARTVLNNQNGWELDYAMEVITTQIAGDIASTQSNIRDLDSIVRDFNPNDERAYARLESFANKIKGGEAEISDTNRVANPNYTLTPDQKNASGGLGDIF